MVSSVFGRLGEKGCSHHRRGAGGQARHPGAGPAAGWQRLRGGQLRPRWQWEARAPFPVSASREQLQGHCEPAAGAQGGSSALSPGRGDPGTTGEGAAPVATLPPLCPLPGTAQVNTARGQGGGAGWEAHIRLQGGQGSPLRSTPLSKAGWRMRPGKEEQQLHAARQEHHGEKSRTAPAGRPPPATHSPRVCGEAQKYPALVVRDGEPPGHKTAFPPSPALAGTPQT